MWRYPKDNLGGNWSLRDLNERVIAAKQLGYEVFLTSTDDGLLVQYKKEIKEIPYEWKY